MLKYPRVLIFGEVFTLNTGGGITLSNLFSGFPEENLAVLSERSEEANGEICHNYYHLGNTELKYTFPLSLLYTVRDSGPLRIIPELNGSGHSNCTPSHNFLKKLLLPFYYIVREFLINAFHFFGLWDAMCNVTFSDDLRNWVDSFKPDLIYCQIFSLNAISLVSSIHRYTKCPVVIHIMDDFVNIINKPGILYPYWRKRIDSEFRELLNHCHRKFAISEKMAEEYKLRYGGEWLYFHNPVDILFWGKYGKDSYIPNSPFEILYSGRLGSGVNNTLKLIAKSIDELVLNEGLDIVLKIQASNKPDWIKNYNCIQFSHFVPYEELPFLFSNVDVLLMPYDFDDEGLKYIKYSMPTKVSEYMITGTPVLVVSPESTALYQYAVDYKWGFVISENKKEAIKNGIKELFGNQKMREELGKIAKEVAEERHNSVKIRKEFVSQLLN